MSLNFEVCIYLLHRSQNLNTYNDDILGCEHHHHFRMVSKKHSLKQCVRNMKECDDKVYECDVIINYGFVINPHVIT